MNTCARSRIALHIILTVLFCAFAVAATSRSLSRTRLGFATQVDQVHRGLERHAFFEVSADGSRGWALSELLILSDRPLLPVTQEQSFQLVNTRQQNNWPMVFSPVYRHIPPSKAADSDLSA
jgi:hypothetical protein